MTQTTQADRTSTRRGGLSVTPARTPGGATLAPPAPPSKPEDAGTASERGAGDAPLDSAEPKTEKTRGVRHVSVVVPAYNEAGVIGETVRRIEKAISGHVGVDYEILVVDDGSTDGTAEVASRAGARVIIHPYNIGNGAAVKTGIRAARGDGIVCIDADGQHRPDDIPELVKGLERYHMVVGARRLRGQASLSRALANWIYNRVAAYITRYPIRDLTSGFRAMRSDALRRFVYLLPNTFSYPTTITLSMLRAGFSVRYVDVETDRRSGRSKIRPLEDGARFFMILIKIATLFAPLRIFLPLALVIFGTGVGYYLYTFWNAHRFTNMGLLLIVLSFLMFSLGLISEQIAQLRYDRSE